jgi:hypothetical protein
VRRGAHALICGRSPCVGPHILIMDWPSGAVDYKESDLFLTSRVQTPNMVYDCSTMSMRAARLGRGALASPPVSTLARLMRHEHLLRALSIQRQITDDHELSLVLHRTVLF